MQLYLYRLLQCSMRSYVRIQNRTDREYVRIVLCTIRVHLSLLNMDVSSNAKMTKFYVLSDFQIHVKIKLTCRFNDSTLLHLRMHTSIGILFSNSRK